MTETDAGRKRTARATEAGGKERKETATATTAGGKRKAKSGVNRAASKNGRASRNS
jgi:hypothetical protein